MSRCTARQNITAFAYDKRGRLLAVGHNSYTRTHRLQAHYALKAGNGSRIYLHAEIDCLIRAKKRGVTHKLVVIRHGAKGTPLCAKPCAACQLAINDFNVKEVEHT